MENNWRKDISAKEIRRIAAGASLAFFLFLLCAVISGINVGFDEGVRMAVYDTRSEWLTPVVKGITYLGNWQTIVILCLLLLAVPKTRRIYGTPLSIGAIAVSLFNKLMKELIHRDRPDDILHLVEEGGLSFPSGHSITSVFVYGLLIYLIRTNVKNRTLANVLTAFLFIPLVGVGLSRIYLGVHYPTDVLAGWFLGIIAVVMAIELMEKKKPA